MNQILKRLEDFDYEALEVFKDLHRTVTTASMSFEATDLNEILETILKSQKFKDRFQGLALLFDEFGDTMEQGNLSPKAFQKVAELCANPPQGARPLLFVANSFPCSRRMPIC